MTKFAGKDISKNTVVSVSVGTAMAGLIALWTISGIGRPLFAADLERIEEKIDDYQSGTAVQILTIRKEALQSELREARRDVRRNPNDDDAADDVEEIRDDIKEIESKIACHRTKGCEVEQDL